MAVNAKAIELGGGPAGYPVKGFAFVGWIYVGYLFNKSRN